MTDAGIEPLSGTYVLILRARSAKRVRIGALGYLRVRSGVYVYVGSAFGPGGVRARVKHHLSRSPAPHWHIDYLRLATELDQVWYTHDPVRREHAWADLFRSARGAAIPLLRFGASDCRCVSHLFYFARPPSFPTFRRQMKRDMPSAKMLRLARRHTYRLPRHTFTASAPRHPPAPVCPISPL